MSQLYFIQSGPGGAVKIGYAENAHNRMIHAQTGNPVPLKLLLAVAGGRAEELAVHAVFQRSRLRGEWFQLTRTLLRFISHLRNGYSLDDALVSAERRLHRLDLVRDGRRRGARERFDYQNWLVISAAEGLTLDVLRQRFAAFRSLDAKLAGVLD